MSAFVVVDLTPKNAEKLKAYSEAAALTVAAFGGEFLAKGPIEVLHGDQQHPVKGIIKFADKAAALNWYRSDEYQALVGVRVEGMDSQFHLVG